jgi:hypothetical protein
MNKEVAVRRGALAIVVAVCTALSANAAEPTAARATTDPAVILLSYVNTPGYLNGVQKMLPLAEVPPMRKRCKDIALLDAGRVSIVEPPVFTQTPTGLRLDGGAWINLVSAETCGQRVTRRFLITAKPNGDGVDYRPLLRGDFRGNLVMENDAKRLATPTLATVAHCLDPAKVFILNIRAQGPETAQGWTEVWDADACGKRATAEVEYVKENGAITIKTRAHKGK